MARNRMEKEFSQKLQGREIQPSAAAWDRLDAMLTASESQPKTIVRKSYKWLYVAAGFLGFLFVGTIFWRQGETTAVKLPATQEVVQSPSKLPQHETVNPIVEPEKELQLAEITSVAESAEAKTKTSQKARKFKFVTSDPEYMESVAQNVLSKLEQKKQSHQSINQKTDELTQNPEDVSVDELLAKAKAKREIANQGAKVNARKLLLEVDSQAEEKLTPRQRAIRALNRNYQQVKVAVENRNYEESH